MNTFANQQRPHRRSWPYFRTPLPIFLFVMLPVNGLMLFVLLSRSEAWQKWSAGAVHALSLYALYRGYLVRLIITDTGVRLRRLFGSIELAWSDIMKVGEYIPGGGLGATEYVFATKHDHAPAGKWDIDENTIQAQAQEGLLESLQLARSNAEGDVEALAPEEQV